ncbi:MAG: excinuclease ABC subunit UvrA [Armatimonadetes bacterium]|nr:excinuclease ABC subunit UvrA [Armatimonadota bacterium]
MDEIIIKGAREHNLKNINLKLPRNKLIVFTGLSGSGKSSLAFDTLYAEGQRRYVESLSSYARQFLGIMEKPDVDYIEGLSPSISIDQKGISKNPRSTVGTITEIYDYLRLLFASIGIPHCHNCGKIISSQTTDQMVDQILSLKEGTSIQILSPQVRGRKGEYQKLFQELCQKGYTKVRIDGEIFSLEEKISLAKYKKHNIEVVIDRLFIKPEIKNRLADSLELALKMGENSALIFRSQGEEILFNQNLACLNCNLSFEELQPRLFSFNSPYGACSKCTGIGSKLEIDPKLIIPDENKSITNGSIIPWGKQVYDFRHRAAQTWFWRRLEKASRIYKINLNLPFKNLSAFNKKIILYGINTGEFNFEGAIPALERKFRETESEQVRDEIQKYMSDHPCPVCHGARLKPQSLAVKINNLNIAEMTRKTIQELNDFFKKIILNQKELLIAEIIVKEIKARLNFLLNVGLDYITLNREARTLSGGEAQRIRLATQIGSGLVGVLYVLDEPSIGLHQRDNKRLLNTLKELRDLGNTLVVIEHDEETILSADYVVDIGPGAGEAGGKIVAQGHPNEIKAYEESLTAKYLSKKIFIKVPEKIRAPQGKFLEIIGAGENNLKNLRVKIPLGIFVCVTGVSGSGKSTLVNEVLYKALARHFYKSVASAGKYQKILGYENIDKVIIIDQSPIGRTPRSNPATYTGLFDPIRELFSLVPEARTRGYKPGRFSFNLKGGRCEACQGQGILQIEMHFLPDVYIPCEACKGNRYGRETLEIHFKGKNIAEVLNLTVQEALEFFKNFPKLEHKLKTINDVGLGYMKLGQAATTLSGGEAQRVKLAAELSHRSTGKTLYILDEPTTGLHFHDISKLLDVLNRLVDAGNTVLIIEHNLEVIKCADYIIDLGPEGGEKGGYIVAQGSPYEIAQNKNSYTGKYLKTCLLM